MNNILIIGAGRSATALINYTLNKAKENNWFVTVADADPALAERKVNNHPNGRATWLDALKDNDRLDLISRADVVVSLLPAHLHFEVAQDCVKLKKHLITASYVSQEMQKLGDMVRSHELIFMGELGLDPGIDHMSAMQRIEAIKAKGGKITAFRSYTGGVIAPESDDNPWHYKFTWNPRNVVRAGSGTAQYFENGKFKYIPYHRLFREYWTVDIQDMGQWEAYANRDSMLYRDIYGLDGIPTILRGTLRQKGFCDAWAALIKIGLTDSAFPIFDSAKLSYHELMEAYVPTGPGSVKERIAALIREEPNSQVMQMLEWLGLFKKTKIKVANAAPSQILEKLLLEKWKLNPHDKDMVIMQHEIEYELGGRKRRHTSTMMMKGENETDTAMARLVGLPMGIFVKLVMEGKITSRGVQIPVMQEVYEPVLKELEEYGVVFKDRDEAV